MVQQTLWEHLRVVLVFLWSGLILSSCGDAKTDRTEGDSPTAASSSSQVPPLAPPRAQGQVLAGRDLGTVVTGSGSEAEARSLEALERQLMSFMPQLEEVYERERTQEPNLMGSLDVQMTIEPNGAVSDLRFPVKRVSSEKLTTAVYDHMRGWIFFPAESPVDFRYRLLFVPPGTEAASIVTWEKHLAGRMVIARGEGNVPPLPLSPPAAAPAVAEQPLPPMVEKTPLANKPVPAEEPQELASAQAASPRKSDQEGSALPPLREKKRPSKLVPGWYEVTRLSVLYTTPDVTAEIVTRLAPGNRVWVVRVVDKDWLEVRSVKGRRPGFLPRETARPERRESAGR